MLFHQDSLPRNSIPHGIYQGVTTWLAFAIVECLYSTLFPWFVGSNYTPPNITFTAALFLLYPAWGALLGAACGWGAGALSSRGFLAATPRPLIPKLALFSLIVMFGLHLQLAWPFSGLTLVAAVFYLALVAALGLAAWSTRWAARITFINNAWTVSFIVLGIPWVVRIITPSESVQVKVAAVVALVLSVMVVSIAISAVHGRLQHLEGGHTSRPAPRRATFILLLASLATFTMSTLPRQHPYVGGAPIPSVTTEPSRPNVVLVVMDTVRADHLSIYGYERDTTPHLASLLDDATLYTNAIATGDMTLISHASILTGMYGTSHGAHFDFPMLPDGRPLAAEFTTLTEVLAAHGYSTLGVVSNFAYLSREFGLQQGFHYYDDRVFSHFFLGGHAFYLRELVRQVLTHFSSPEVFDKRFRNAETINASAFDLIGSAREAEAPFFLFLNYMDAHWPYLPPAPFDTRYPGKLDGYTTKRYDVLKERLMSLVGKMPKQDRDHLVSQYDGAIAYLDAQLGLLIEYLKNQDLYDDTLIIVTSDHGETFGERNLLEHAVSVYQDQVRVPLVVKAPNSHEPAEINVVVSGVDIMPTVLDFVGVSSPAHLDGRSLLDRDATKEVRFIVSESFGNPFFIDWHPRFDRTERAIYSDSFKYIRSTSGKQELYDLEANPMEQANRVDGELADAGELDMRLDAWLEAKRGRENTSTPETLSDETLRQLRSLGYVR